MKIFVTGFHRAGTHSMAEYLAKKHGVPYIEEAAFGFNRYDKVVFIANAMPLGFVIQCPHLAHRCEDFAKLGKVIWMKRNEEDLIKSMKNSGLHSIAWGCMKAFNFRYPNDPIWQTAKYDGSKDVFYEFTGYYSLLKKVKDYFCDKYFKPIVDVRYLEDQPFYEPHKPLAKRKMLNDMEVKWLEEQLYNASICVDKAQRTP